MQVVCEPLVVTLAYLGVVGPLARPALFYPGARGEQVARGRSRHRSSRRKRRHFFRSL